MIQKAYEFAFKAHQGQSRKYDGSPYILHPLEVATILLVNAPRSSDEAVAAALLHDVVEDTRVTLEEIQMQFGCKVARLVHAVTTPKLPCNRAARVRAEGIRLSTIPPEAQNIKYADIMSNVRDIREKDPDFADVYLREKRWLILHMEDGHGPLRHSAWLRVLEGLRPRHPTRIGGK